MTFPPFTSDPSALFARDHAMACARTEAALVLVQRAALDIASAMHVAMVAYAHFAHATRSTAARRRPARRVHPRLRRVVRALARWGVRRG